MTDEEYIEFLNALALKHLWRSYPADHYQASGVEVFRRLAAIGRLNRGAAKSPDSADLSRKLAAELRESPIRTAVRQLDDVGVIAALEEDSEKIFENLRRSVIPDEDVGFMKDAGISVPEAEILSIIQYAQYRVGKPNTRPAAVLHSVERHLKNAAVDLVKLSETEDNKIPEDSRKVSERSKRKIFGGIGKILAGTVTGVGNTLLGLGTIAAPNPATAYGVIASAALAVGGICQGIGDLRGE